MGSNGGIILERNRKWHRLEWTHRSHSCVYILGSGKDQREFSLSRSRPCNPTLSNVNGRLSCFYGPHFPVFRVEFHCSEHESKSEKFLWSLPLFNINKQLKILCTHSKRCHFRFRPNIIPPLQRNINRFCVWISYYVWTLVWLEITFPLLTCLKYVTILTALTSRWNAVICASEKVAVHNR